jgi:nickel transport protein
MKISAFLATALLPLGLIFTAESVSAHAIQTNYQLKLEGLEIRASYGDGEAFPDAAVTVYSPANPDEPILLGRTDAEGKFNFRPDPAVQGDWEVEIGEENDGHWDAIVVPVRAEGIDLDAISQVEPIAPAHRHDYVAYSFLLMTVAASVGFGWRSLQDQGSSTSLH